MRSQYIGMIAGMVFASAAMVQRAPAGTLDQQLREQYPAGTVFVVKMKGIFAVTGQCPVAPAAAFKDVEMHLRRLGGEGAEHGRGASSSPWR